jgi:hypothetical protein
MGAIIVLISVMIATIIGAVIFFSFGQSADIAARYTQTQTVSNAAIKQWISLSYEPSSSPSYNISITNMTGVVRYIESGHYNYTSANKTIGIEASEFVAGATNDTGATITISFYGLAHDTTVTVTSYAVTTFAMAAIIPLIIVGGIMLRSLGMFTGGKEV